MDPLSNFTAQTTTPRKASLLARIGMPETRRSASTTAPSTTTKARHSLNGPSLLERMQLSEAILLKDDSALGTEHSELEKGSATGCSPTVHFATRPMRRKHRLSQAPAAASSSGNAGADLKPSLLSRLDDATGLEAREGPQTEDMPALKIKGSAAALRWSPEIKSTPSFGYRRARNQQRIMDHIRMDEAKKLSFSRGD
ncbi:hypothetical protein D9619_000475 [Psilocybe cf. subviscida]|uniref:Uncharacterized protein n=1 Tax=Psilocybe cf. subviscida TaxID=2480587 RepID=A0A8H5BGT0_9AGAR|nr:hypothetical protein D9619_000475 [Psilocybe cf. subviscida]